MKSQQRVELCLQSREYVRVNATETNLAHQRTPAAALDEAMRDVQRFLQRLIHAQRRLQGAAQGDPEIRRRGEQLTALLLAEAGLRLSLPREGNLSRPPQIAVMGPTQTGKSTLVNILLGVHVAEVSPLAGFTVHPHGFAIDGEAGTLEWADDLLPQWTRREPGELSRNELNAYTLTELPEERSGADGDKGGRPLPTCVVWDTPDFDSLAAHTYQQGVLEIAALADAYLLVLSKEKYSDLSVWKLLRLLEPLGGTLAICLNKLTPEAVDPITRSLRGRLSELGSAWGDVEIVPIEYAPEIASSKSGAAGRIAQDVRHIIRSTLHRQTGRTREDVLGLRSAGTARLIERHWEPWVAEIQAEHQAIDEWDQMIDAGLTSFVETYQRDYLNHPQRYDALRRAAVELLDLLELPRVGRWLAGARQVVTWPVRQLFAAGREWHSQWRGNEHPMRSLGAEASVLFDAAEHLLTALQRDLARMSQEDSAAAPVWRALDRRLQANREELRSILRDALAAHHEQLSREIHAAATELYESLQQHPRRLAALRAGRTSMDVGYMLLAVKTGGLTPIDVVWAPATFAFTSLLMESFAGMHMRRIGRNLREKQLARVRRDLVDGVLRAELHALAEQLDEEGLFGISAAELHEARQALNSWEQLVHA